MIGAIYARNQGNEASITRTTRTLDALLALGVFVFAALACGGGSPNPRPEPPATAQKAPAATPAQKAPAVTPAPAAPAEAGPCLQIKGESSEDAQHLSEFCRKGIVKGTVMRAEAMQSLLWLYVTRPMADAIRADKLSAEQVIKVWMRGWRQVTGRNSVTVYVKWQDVEIATGQTSMFSGDQITIR